MFDFFFEGLDPSFACFLAGEVSGEFVFEFADFVFEVLVHVCLVFLPVLDVPFACEGFFHGAVELVEVFVDVFGAEFFESFDGEFCFFVV